MGREFNYSRSLSTISVLSYLSLTSIFFTYSAIYHLAAFTAVVFRIGEILKMEEFDTEAAKDDETLSKGVRISLENTSLSWDPQDSNEDKNKYLERKDNLKSVQLKNLTLEVKEEELVAVVGTVGCGKSTLLAGLMHELKVPNGKVRTRGTKAYVEQEPFVMSGTVKENILFGRDFNQARFDEVVEACCLTHDLKVLPKGVDTDLSERGVTVSGGQKARISLARAVYANADIYLLDDPLSAVDPEVAELIFK